MMSDETNKDLDNQAMDWEDEIEDDGQEFIVLPEGDYTFYVENMERGRFPGSAKLSPCPKAALTLRVQTEDGKVARIFTDIILNKVLEWKISGFFRSIGQKKHGEKLKMDWNKVIGSTGRAHIKVRTYTDKNGDQRQKNDVDNYIDWDDEFAKDAPKAEFSEVTGDAANEELPF